MKKKACVDRPCADCPWLRENQTPEAVAKSPVDGSGVHWFSRENLLRHWRGMQRIGIMLPCHKTDDHAHFYGGRPTACGQTRICVGMSVLARREVLAFMQAGQDFAKYRKVPGRRFSAVGLAAWAARLFFGGSTFHTAGRTFVMPEHVEEDARVGVPWPDSVHDAKGSAT